MLVCLLLLKNSICYAVVLNVKSFGAKGDGVTDDYIAILKAVAELNKLGRGTLYFPKGTYQINRFHSVQTIVADITINNCNDVRIAGDNSVINVYGKFFRSSDRTKGKFSYSNVSAIIPFTFRNCSGIVLENIEINGNVNRMTKDPSVVESGGHLLKFSSCSNVILRNVYVHHAQTDGIYINDKCRDFKFTNVVSTHNARQGMSVIELNAGYFRDCHYKFNGITEGKYGGHAPRSGVDVEPSMARRQVVRDILFVKCTFAGNAGSQFICSQPKTTFNVKLDSCNIRSLQSKSQYQMILSANNTILQNSEIVLEKGNIYPLWEKFPGSSTSIINCKISGSEKGILAISNDRRNYVLIRGNNLVFTGVALTTYFPYLQAPNLAFLNNSIKLPAAVLRSGKPTSLIQGADVSSGNVFSTEKSNIRPKASYKGTKKVLDKR
jgi:hypothetical protein